MNRKRTSLGNADYAEEPFLTAAQRGALEERLEHLKEQLLQPLLVNITNAAAVRELRRAAGEAAALAWFSVCPILVLPLLLEEKVSSALKWWERQQRLKPELLRINQDRAEGTAI